MLKKGVQIILKLFLYIFWKSVSSVVKSVKQSFTFSVLYKKFKKPMIVLAWLA